MQVKMIMSHEKALVILLGRIDINELVKTRIFHIIKNGIDWYAFLSHCLKTNMVCLVYKNMIRLGIEKLLPAIVKSNMRYHYEQNILRNQFLIVYLDKLLGDLASNNIVVEATRGIKFLKTIYEDDPGVRILSDIDILAKQSDKAGIHYYMTGNKFCTYLINNKDAFCLENSDVECQFYINFCPIGLNDDLRIDFDYSCSEDFIKKISENNYIYEYCYLCRSYYSSMKKKSWPYSIDQFDYIKLVDIYEYYKKFLIHTTKSELQTAVKQMHFANEVKYVIECIEQLFPHDFMVE